MPQPPYMMPPGPLPPGMVGPGHMGMGPPPAGGMGHHPMGPHFAPRPEHHPGMDMPPGTPAPTQCTLSDPQLCAAFRSSPVQASRCLFVDAQLLSSYSCIHMYEPHCADALLDAIRG